MLVLSRKVRESIVIDGRIKVTVLRIGGSVRLGIEAPEEVPIRRDNIKSVPTGPQPETGKKGGRNVA